MEEQGARARGGELTKPLNKEDLKVIEGFRHRLIAASNKSQDLDDHKDLADALGITRGSGDPIISLEVWETNDLERDKNGKRVTGAKEKNSGTQVERAIRRKVNDDLTREGGADVIVDDQKIEVTHTAEKTKKMKVDYSGLTKSTKKWYLFIEGNINPNKQANYTAWLVRSDKLVEQIDRTPADQKIHVDDISDDELAELTPSAARTGNPIKEIEREIDKIKGYLSRTIYYRSRGVGADEAAEIAHRKGERNSTTLEKQIGHNSVRLSIAFDGPRAARRDTSESLLRRLVRENL